jgi:hypothetical protein
MLKEWDKEEMDMTATRNLMAGSCRNRGNAFLTRATITSKESQNIHLLSPPPIG